MAGLRIRPYDYEKIPPEMFPEVRLGAMTRDELRAAAVPGNGGTGLPQGAALGMRAIEVGSESNVMLTNLRSGSPTWAFRLTAPTLRMYLRMPYEDPVEPHPRIRAVILEPDQDTVVVVWVGEVYLEVVPTDEQFEAAEHAVVWAE